MLNSRIIQLEAVVSNQIAAGEVVERPASVVKELLENSIDAGATKIEVEIEGGGIHLIRVRDNGSGILREDLPLAFLRHATSKIQTREDLTSIQSLGFRGEALASIASVSRSRLISRALNQESAWQIQIQNDLSYGIQPAAHPQGTTIEVADLFYNTPVRRKFLRSEKTEFQAIDDILKRLSLAYPSIGFTLKHQQRQIRSFTAISSPKEEMSRIGKICGLQFIEQAIGFSTENNGMQLKGWLAPPQLGHRHADCQYFFVNQRMVKDRLLSHALKSVYQQEPQYVEGTYPSYVLFLTIDPKEVDVNVHPTKQEVRFSESRFVHDFITKCIAMALTKRQEIAQPVPTQVSSNTVASVFPTKASFSREEVVGHIFSEKKAAIASTPKIASFFLQRYGFSEDEKGVILIDLIKSKSSLIRFYLENEWGHVPQKTLLFPLPIALKAGVNLTQEKLNLLESIGLFFRMENRSSLVLLAQPSFLEEEELGRSLSHFISGMPLHWTREAVCQCFADCPSLQSLHKLLKSGFADHLENWLDKVPTGMWIRLTHQKLQSFFELKIQEV